MGSVSVGNIECLDMSVHSILPFANPALAQPYLKPIPDSYQPFFAWSTLFPSFHHFRIRIFVYLMTFRSIAAVIDAIVIYNKFKDIE